MRRRDFLVIVSGGATWPISTLGQTGKPRRIAVLGSAAESAATSRDEITWLNEGLLESGLREGHDYVLDVRYAAGDYRLFPLLIEELLAANPAVVVAFTLPAAKAAQSLTKAVPIVMVANDPVGQSLVSSLARPGGNVTGIATMNEDLTLKAFELVREAFPTTTKIVALANPTNPSGIGILTRIHIAAARSGIALRAVELARPDALDRAFEEIATENPDFLLLVPDTALTALTPEIVSRASGQRIPVIGTFREQAGVGALITYGRVRRATVHRMASYIKRIFEGSAPNDLPVEQPTSFELVVNLKTAEALGLTVPPPLLARADEVIE
jgi:putative ABC transport system substrate-binding protein